LAYDHRIDQDGHRLDYTCANRRYRTNINMGESHGEYTATRGSVLREPLADGDGYSLWLEHVTEDSGDEHYWLMWYDSRGFPTIPLSGILDRDDIANMQRLLASFIP
jgi:hypothetical protein